MASRSNQFGMALAFQGRFDEAIAEGRRAAELDPLSLSDPDRRHHGAGVSGRFRAGQRTGQEGRGTRSRILLPRI
jgi:hypothetical protein